MPLMTAQEADFGQTPSQTVGPYFAYGLTATQYGYDFDQPFDAVLALDNASGERIRLEGRVIDGDGNPINDALVEISQPDGEGRYPQTPDEARALGFRAFGRVGTGTTEGNRFVFHTVKPGAQAPGEAPHINVIVLMRGLLLHAFTRVYFGDEAAANAKDEVLQSVPADRRHTLVAERVVQGGAVSYRFDIRMQGTDETAFFDV
ncbi:protocatechuate 3,4-dioxygenase subunit alpha [Variovorax sp. J22G73]|jgi:protocatechuate 3,4-dioxygenase alpha subunit|uniref:protocatechuate 3,4-dioxygenase subunit alpha n=1 Tax=unclassified Variovorax TaxID=663243 RepID=UPI000D5CD8B2|nr:MULTISPECIES: protocatechuate 3,4-dioxygenase subunit alpha [unclassified Variovorax]MDM0006973.1 protocatechuate 3,4-dioxygenase subunit alpha [Variovorax sp. J22R203]MDM0099275.1 protocatechuate 3,4-dioxygenase subunit alpha [Variovorax sp. J22G73]